MPGLFGTLNTGKSGLFTQQYAIDVTSHNISNANTEGYTRQRAIMEATQPYCMPSLNTSTTPGQLGTGSQVSTIQRIRNEFTDYQIRNENSNVGNYEVTSDYLAQIENLFADAADDNGLSKSIGDFYQSFNKLSTNPEDKSSRVAVSTAANTLCKALNESYNKLQELKTDGYNNIKSKIANVNAYLNQVDTFNQQIMGVKLSGQEPNDLMDKRDNLLDKLSKEFGISISNQNNYGIDVSAKNAAGTGSTNLSLIKSANRENENRISYVDSIVRDGAENADGTANYTLSYYKFGDDATSNSNKVTISLKNVSDDQLKNLQESRSIWADKDGVILDKNGDKLSDGSVVDLKTADLMYFKADSGEFKGFQTVEANIDTYIDNLNKISKCVAFSINALHSGISNTVSSSDTIADPTNTKAKQTVDYMPFFVNSDVATSKYTTDSSGNVHLLYDPNATDHTKTNGTSNLRDVLAAEKDINAGNISVNRQIVDDPFQIKAKTHDDQFAYENYNNVDGNGNGDRALGMKQLNDASLNITTISDATTRNSFVGTLESSTSLGIDTISNSKSGMTVTAYYSSVAETLGTNAQTANSAVTSHQGMLDSYNELKQATSGVSSDEEMANLVQYMHAYQANAKVISTVDKLLEVVINGLIK